ncbi:c-type cytochrome [Burkholderia stagnalis]
MTIEQRDIAEPDPPVFSRFSLTPVFRFVAALLLSTSAASGICAQPGPGDAATADLVARGAYLARAADCAACHRDPRNAASPYAGGLAIHSPLGDIVASNITPSRRAGIGAYTEADFRRALRDGIRGDGQPLYPAMPYTAYRKITDGDIHALYLYFTRAVPADDHRTAPTLLPFPFSIRASMRVWNALFLDDAPQAPLSPELARGRYLVDALEHCSACHSPRGALMQEDNRAYLSGGSVGAWHAPNITSDRDSGIGRWTRDELIEYLRTGHARGKAQAAGPMGEVVEYSLGYLSAVDLNAIALYLEQVPPVAGPARKTAAAYPPASANQAGARLFSSACAACHRAAGQGAYDDYFPSLTHNTAVDAARPDNLVMSILDGVSRRDGTTRIWMPAFRDTLNDTQVAELANYVSLTFGGRDAGLSPDRVATLRGGGDKPAIAWLPTALYVSGGALLIAVLVFWRFAARRRR